MLDLSNAGEIKADNLTKLFSQAPAPIAIYKGRELRYVFVNEAYSKIFNHREILGKTVREAFPELAGQSYYEILENVYDTGTPYHAYETPALIDVNNNGNMVTCYYNLVYTPYKDDKGTIEGVMAFGHDVTALVQAREREVESDIRFRNIVEQSTDPILILKGNELVLDVANNALFRLWNIDKESLGKPFLEILPEMKDQGFYELLLDVLQNGTTHYGQEKKAIFKRANGSTATHYFNFIYQPYREEEGIISGVLVLSTDVTEQVLAKQKLARSQSNFRNMILQAPVAMCVLKGKNHIVEIANDQMYEIWNKNEVMMLGKPLFESLPEARGQGFERLLDDVFFTGRRFLANERLVQLQGNGAVESKYVNFVYEALRESDGSISGIIAVATDVTEQVMARQKIEFAEANARLAIESADLGTYEVNLVTNEMVTSPRFDAIWGFEGKMAKRAELAAVIHAEDMPVRRQAHAVALKTGNLNYEARINLQNGSQRWVRVKGKVLFNEQNTPERLLGVIQDITEQKLFAEELSVKVEERTKALKEAKERLERTNEELEQFAYVTSHDLQEPLRKIQLFSNMVLQHPDKKEHAKKYLEKIDAAAIRMSGLIKDLLEYSKLSQESLQFEETDLNVVLGNVLTDFEVLITQKNAIVKCDVLPTLQAIPLQINQLFYNLLGNALKFTRKDVTPYISITSARLGEEAKKNYRQLDVEKEYYEIRISDNGIGFRQEYADKIFTIFQTLNEKSSYGGYGIGLALCRKIVLTHLGVLFAKSKPDEGATFVIILPATQPKYALT